MSVSLFLNILRLFFFCYINIDLYKHVHIISGLVNNERSPRRICCDSAVTLVMLSQQCSDESRTLVTIKQLDVNQTELDSIVSYITLLNY